MIFKIFPFLIKRTIFLVRSKYYSDVVKNSKLVYFVTIITDRFENVYININANIIDNIHFFVVYLKSISTYTEFITSCYVIIIVHFI